MQITKPRTQRKKLFQAPLHLRHKHFSAALSADLKNKHGTNAFPLKTGDTVRIMRGDRKGFEGKVTRVNHKKYRILVEGVTREKVDGTTVQIPVHPSKVTIVNLNLDDKWRRKALNRKGVHPPKEEPRATVAASKPPKKPRKKAAKKKPIRQKTTGELPQEKKETAKKTGRRKPKKKKKSKVKKGAE